jgi:hypothetical protein
VASIPTSKERDAETGLDFFGARHMSSAQGRFTTVDPVFATASLFNPQSFRDGITFQSTVLERICVHSQQSTEVR